MKDTEGVEMLEGWGRENLWRLWPRKL